MGRPTGLVFGCFLLFLPVMSARAAAPAGDTEVRQFWAFQPVQRPSVPRVRDTGWPKSPIDRFILLELEAKGLGPAPAADRRTLLRRATFALIGLPPTIDEITAFIHDDSSGAFSRVVDRLLASPQYGERWGRHWLDVARYADSNGMDENLSFSNAFRYRDYVVAAFNKGKPYDQFVREQLAGDLMPHSVDEAETIERQIATGFLAVGPKMLAEDDPVKMRVDIIDEQIDTLGRAFMGMSLGCARCHDHKFDPIPTEDYYSLVGIFLSTKTMENYKVVADWYERPVAPTAVIQRWTTYTKRVDEKKTALDRIITRANDTLLGQARLQTGVYLQAGADLRRYETVMEDLKPVMVDPGATAPAGGIVVEAEDFSRGNVEKVLTGVGEGIGIITSKEGAFVEYDIEVSEPGAYVLELRFASTRRRPLRLIINRVLLKEDVARVRTGSSYPDGQRWSVEGIFSLQAGRNTIRLQRQDAFPNIDKLAIIPWNSPASPVPTLTQLRQSWSDRELPPIFVKQWSRYLAKTRNDVDSVLAAWHAFESGLPLRKAIESASKSVAAVFKESDLASREALADRYQELFTQAEHAWRNREQSGEGKKTDALPDPRAEAFRQVLYDRRGPFAIRRRRESGAGRELEPYYPPASIAQLETLRQERKHLEKAAPPEPPRAMGVTEGEIENSRINIRGNHVNLGAEVPRRFPRFLAGETQASVDAHTSGRRELAAWLTRSDHPLTARVMVNRIWRWHFGAGIVRTTDNFGTTGERPVNQPLLDWLAVQFVESGWSIKAMHRLIMLSAVYQSSTEYNERAAQLDPDNRLLWRMNRRRLEAEALRDAILAVAGQLDTTQGGTLLKVKNRAYVTTSGTRITDEYNNTRRSIYVPVVRSAVYEMFQAFDFPDPGASSGHRATTTVAPQALFMINSDLMTQQSRAMAERLLAAPGRRDVERVRLAYETAYARLPTDVEVNRAMDFIELYERALESREENAETRRRRAWQAFCRSVMSASEFVYVD